MSARRFAIQAMSDSNWAHDGTGRLRTFATEANAITAAMKLARDLAGDSYFTKVVVKEGNSQWERVTIHTFPVSNMKGTQ